MIEIKNRLNNQPENYFITNVINTVNTTRINHDDIYYYNVSVSNMIYPSKNISWRPNAVILVPSDKWQLGACASSVVHFPFNAPIFFTERNFMPPIVLNEILRLDPTGEGVPAKVLIAGPVSLGVENYLKSFGLTTYKITDTDNVYNASAEIANFRLNIVPTTSQEVTQDIIVISGQYYGEGIPATFYAAHMGTPIILVQKDFIPQSIVNFISNNPSKNYYLLGSELTIGQNVEQQIRNMISGNVNRITGNSPFEVSVNFSKYESPTDNFGWKHNTANGWAFSYGELNNWNNIISSVLLAHLGKHTPLLVIDKNYLPAVVREYVINVNPRNMMPEPPYMHAYILGSFSDISYETQVEIEKVTNIMAKMEH